LLLLLVAEFSGCRESTVEGILDSGAWRKDSLEKSLLHCRLMFLVVGQRSGSFFSSLE